MGNLAKLIATLKEKKLSIAAAESCSGGYLSYLLTKIPGSSQVFKGAIIAYSPEVKQNLLKIPASELATSAGVSGEVCSLLAKNARKLLNTALGVAVVGFAGPRAEKGATPGTVFVSAADKNGVETKKIILRGSRDKIRKLAGAAAIDLIYKRISEKSDQRQKTKD